MATEPLLMRFAVRRQLGAALPGFYDDEKQVWVVETSQGVVPLVESTGAPAANAELFTKTNAERERDDPGASELLELLTKTANQLERDDVDPKQRLLELITLTKIGSERPDI